MEIIIEDIIKLLLAILLGGLIGIEREFRDKAAGFRTIIFICIGATLFTIFSVRLSTTGDPGRIAANIVTGVGFLGAGVLLRNEGRILGLTTAAIVWLTAAIGMGIGSGEYMLAITTSILMLFVLWVFPRVEAFINKHREERIYEITFTGGQEKYAQLISLFQQNRLSVRTTKQQKTEASLIYILDVVGSPQHHNRLTDALVSDPEIISFSC